MVRSPSPSQAYQLGGHQLEGEQNRKVKLRAFTWAKLPFAVVLEWAPRDLPFYVDVALARLVLR